MIRIIGILSILLATALVGHGQTYAAWECTWGEFLRGDHILFEDDFSTYPANTFPTKWNARGAIKGSVKNVAGSNVFAFYGSNVSAEPATARATGKWITFECDYTLKDTSRAVLQVLFFTDSAGTRRIGVSHNYLFEKWEGDDQNAYGFNYFGAPVTTSDTNKNDWHHLAITFSKDCMDYFIDGKRLMGLGHDTEKQHVFKTYKPHRFAIAGNGPFAIRNVLFAEFTQLPQHRQPSSGKPLQEGKIGTRVILFEHNKAVVTPENIVLIKQFADWLKSHPSTRVRIEGHTDNIGNETLNKKLSTQRAEEVKKQLEALGIGRERLTIKGYGATKPVQPNDTEEGRVANRRVEFITK
jgi:outer membrane protein OmpA-like peptidoglycan-associated protein